MLESKDLKNLQKLIRVLRKGGIKHFQGFGVELDLLEASPSEKAFNSAPSPSDVPEASLPADLRTDNITSADTILNWSASPDPSEEPLPGTGDLPLEV